MKKRLMAMGLCVALCVLCATGLALATESDGLVKYIGIALQDLTVRATMSASGEGIESIAQDEEIEIISQEGDWLLVLRNDVEGYVESGLVTITESLIVEDAPVEETEPPTSETFVPVYSARISKQASMRGTAETKGKLVATLYANDVVELGEVGEEWTAARKGGKFGFVLTKCIKDLDVLSPYRALEYGVCFPYAAKALRSTAIQGTVFGNLGELQTIPSEAVIAVGEPDSNGEIPMPYLRTVGTVNQSAVELEPVVPVTEAQPGDLVGVYSTFFTPDSDHKLKVGRLHNIEKGIQLIDNYVVKSGGKFSFNDLAAPYTQGNGYELGPIINYVSDKKSGFGGGICQVSTTLYNVLLQLPIEIVHWQTHSSRGIEYAPVGFDAAVGAGGLDLEFINQMPFAVRMRANVWEGVVTVRFYRDAEGQ